jgi:acyl-CoA thioesterase II
VDAHTLLGIEPTHNRFRWKLVVTPDRSSFNGNLFGGIGLGAGIAAMENVTGRTCIWASAQFLSFAPVGSVIDIDVVVVVDGRNTTQARAIGHVEDREIFTVNAALGHRDTPGSGEWAQRPEVAPPNECPEREFRMAVGGSINEHIEMRVANGRGLAALTGEPSDDGRSAMWTRLRTGGDASSAPLLGILGDFVPYGLGQAIGDRAGGSSLDNTLRMVRRVSTEWVLLDIRVHGLANGFGHGLVHQWAETGELLATCSQTVVLRYHNR